MKFKLRKGLDLPITGTPSDVIETQKDVDRVAIVGTDYIGMKPTMLVKEGDSVQIGQPLFSCKKNIGLMFTAPAAGKVISINRGERRAFQSIEIDVTPNETHKSFTSFTSKPVGDYSDEEIRKLLIESGAWTSIRQRPFNKVAAVDGEPHSIFVTATDTNPLSPSPDGIIKARQKEFHVGLTALSQLSNGPVYVCTNKNSTVTVPSIENLMTAEFSGPHPAGNAGTHIHFIDPAGPTKTIWHVGYQDVIEFGHLFLSGERDPARVISVAGPLVKSPRLFKTRIGAKISQLIRNEVTTSTPNRTISGSVLHGHKAEGAFDFLSLFSNQVTIIEEDTSREFLGWHSPGFNKFSLKNIYFSKLSPTKKFSFGSSTNGSLRSMVPIGSFEKVMPLDILPTQLLRALASNDVEGAQDLGCLELAEEDLALLTFVAPGKVDFAPMLRANLDTIEKEG